MIRLSLLPPEQKKKLQATLQLQRLSIAILLCGLALLASVGSLWGARSLLHRKLDTLNAQLTTVERDSARFPFATLTQTANDRYQLLKQLLNEPSLSSTQYADLLAALPDGVSVKKIVIVVKDSQFQIDGTAVDRTTFLELRSKLEALPFLESVEAPISNLTQREGLTFSLHGRWKR